MKEYSHYILTRFNTQLVNNKLLYDDPEKAELWMEQRMGLFRETKKSVLQQEGDFNWVISLDIRTPHKYLDEIFTDERMIRTTCDVRNTFREINCDTYWVITSRFDCDDQYKPGFIKAIAENFEPKIKVLDIRFEEMAWPSRQVFSGERRWAGSMFLSLIEPTTRILTAFCRPHGMVAGGYPLEGEWDTGWGYKEIIPYQIIEKELAYMVCHDNNIANVIRGKYKYTL